MIVCVSLTKVVTETNYFDSIVVIFGSFVAVVRYFNLNLFELDDVV